MTLPQALHPQMPTALRFTANCGPRRSRAPRQEQDLTDESPARAPRGRCPTGGMRRWADLRCVAAAALRPAAHLAAELARVLGVLADLHLLDDFTQAGTVAGAILADDADLLGALGLRGEEAEGAPFWLWASCAASERRRPPGARHAPSRRRGGCGTVGRRRRGRFLGAARVLYCRMGVRAWRSEKSPPGLSAALVIAAASCRGCADGGGLGILPTPGSVPAVSANKRSERRLTVHQGHLPARHSKRRKHRLKGASGKRRLQQQRRTWRPGDSCTARGKGEAGSHADATLLLQDKRENRSARSPWNANTQEARAPHPTLGAGALWTGERPPISRR